MYVNILVRSREVLTDVALEFQENILDPYITFAFLAR